MTAPPRLEPASGLAPKCGAHKKNGGQGCKGIVKWTERHARMLGRGRIDRAKCTKESWGWGERPLAIAAVVANADSIHANRERRDALILATRARLSGRGGRLVHAPGREDRTLRALHGPCDRGLRGAGRASDSAASNPSGAAQDGLTDCGHVS